jgi:hypothetical protein
MPGCTDDLRGGNDDDDRNTTKTAPTTTKVKPQRADVNPDFGQIE